MNYKKVLLLAVIFVLFFSFKTFAEEVVYDSISVEEMADILKKMGIDPIEKTDEKIVFHFSIEGIEDIFINLFFSNEKKEGDKKFQGIQLGAGFSIEDYTVGLEKVNNWNQSKNFSRAYVDKNKNIILQTDVVIKGGITEKNIINNIMIFAISIANFLEFISNPDI